MDNEDLLRRLFDCTPITPKTFRAKVELFMTLEKLNEAHTFCPLKEALSSSKWGDEPELTSVEVAEAAMQHCCAFCDSYFPGFRRHLGLGENWCPCSCLGIVAVVEHAKKMLVELDRVEEAARG